MDITIGNSKTKSDAIVLGEFDDKKFSKEFKSLDTKLKKHISLTIKDEDIKLKAGETLVLRTNGSKSNYKKVIIVGLGKKSDLDTKTERKAIAAAIRAAKAVKAKTVLFRNIKNVKLLAETAVLVSYSFDKYKKSKSKSDKDSYKNIEKLLVLGVNNNAKVKKEIKEGKIIGESTCLARDLIWEPACAVTPSSLARTAQKIKRTSMKLTIKNKKDCERLGMGAYLAVAQGSDEPPKFIELVYTPKGKIKKHIAIVGKGVTFDSGGLSLKPPKAMEMMKEDMSGAAGMLGVMNAIGQLQPKGVKITMIVAATENMPSGKAVRPGDVVTAMNGKTIEINNTDAEGRLTLADAVAYVSGKNPDEIIDMATLTGACMVALGNVCAGMMTNNQALLDRVKKHADDQGELMWQLPLYDEYKSKLKSSIADYINAGAGGKAGAQNGGLFVGEFVGPKGGKSKSKKEDPIPWLHLDIAGPCWLEDDSDWSPKGASGIGVRTLVDYIVSH